MYLSSLDCPRCRSSFDPKELQNLCSCGSPLLARYDLAAVRAAVTRDEIATRPADLWRYRELLPIASPDSVVSLGEGWTPLWRAGRYGVHIGLSNLLVKDE